MELLDVHMICPQMAGTERNLLLLNVCDVKQYKSSRFLCFLFDIFLMVCEMYVHMSKHGT